MSARPDLDSFLPGATYVHSDSDELVEFIGIAWAGGEHGEDVAVFRRYSDGGCLIASERTHSQGETFELVTDVM